MNLKEMAAELDKFPIGSTERCNGVETTLGNWTIKLKEPAYLFRPGGGYRLEVYEDDGFLGYIQNSYELEGITKAILREIRLCCVFEEIV